MWAGAGGRIRSCGGGSTYRAATSSGTVRNPTSLTGATHPGWSLFHCATTKPVAASISPSTPLTCPQCSSYPTGAAKFGRLLLTPARCAPASWALNYLAQVSLIICVRVWEESDELRVKPIMFSEKGRPVVITHSSVSDGKRFMPHLKCLVSV